MKAYTDLEQSKKLAEILPMNRRQKPTDKVAPKFHEGEWVVDKNGTVQQILSYKNGIYKRTNGYSSKMFEDEWRLWDITKDAKDGDILACGDKIADCPFIFHNVTKELNPRSYCGVNTAYQFQDNDENGGCWCYSNEVRPATKEQREFLFKKMHEAGYEWDANKKELKLLITNGGDFESMSVDEEVQKLHDHLEMHKELNDANVRKEFKWDSENKIMTIYGVTYEEMKALDDFIYCLRSETKCPKGVEKARSEMKSEPQAVTFIDSGTMQVIDKLNEIIGKLGDIHQVLSKPFLFPYRDYTPLQEALYETHGVEKVPPVTCETTNGFNKSEDNESK